MTDKDQRIEELEQQLRAFERKLEIVEGVHAVFLAQAIKHQFRTQDDREAYRQSVLNPDTEIPFLVPSEAKDVLNRVLDLL